MHLPGAAAAAAAAEYRMYSELPGRPAAAPGDAGRGVPPLLFPSAGGPPSPPSSPPALDDHRLGDAVDRAAEKKYCGDPRDDPAAGGPRGLLGRAKRLLGPAFYVAAWFLFSTTLIFSNRYILVDRGFSFPLSLTTIHLLIATAATRLLRATAADHRLMPGAAAADARLTWRKWARRVLPIGALFSLTLACGNYAYLFLSVAFIQMLKSITPVAILLASWIFGVDKPSASLFFNIIFIALGVGIASFGEIRFVLVGFLLMLAGISFDAVRLVMIQKLLKSESLQMDTLTSLYYIAPVSAGCNMLISIIFESSSVTLDKFLNVGLWPFVLNGIVSFGLNVAAVSVVKNTSTLTLGLAGVLKDILIVGMAMLFYGTPMTLLQAFGYTMAMTGLMYYKNGKDVFGLCSGGCRFARPSVLHYRQVAQIGLLLMAVASCVLLYRVKDEVQYVDQTAACADRVVQLTVVQSAHIGLPAPEGFPTSDKVAVIVETRALPTLVPLIMHFAGVLAWDWHFHIFYSDANSHMLLSSNPIQRMIESGKLNMTLIPPLIEMGNGELTSRFMTDPWLWSQIQQENILIFQADSVLCARSNRRPEDFFEYDYVGAPWPASDESGNGGLSLRKRSHTLRCIREQPRKPGMAEDVYFSRTLQSIGALVAPRDVSAAFSVEAEFEAEPLGVHQLWASAFPKNKLSKLYEYCPEIALTGWQPDDVTPLSYSLPVPQN